jgi:hypothetical protein
LLNRGHGFVARIVGVLREDVLLDVLFRLICIRTEHAVEFKLGASTVFAQSVAQHYTPRIDSCDRDLAFLG